MRKVLINAGLGVLSALVGGASFLTPAQANAAPKGADQPTNPGFSEGYPKAINFDNLPNSEEMEGYKSRYSFPRHGVYAGELGKLSTDMIQTVEIAPGKYAYTYCIEPGIKYYTFKDDPTTTLTAGDWSGLKAKDQRTPLPITNDKDRQQGAQWVTENGYPTKDLDQLRADSGVSNLTRPEAISATRAALLHYVDNRELQGAVRFDKNEFKEFELPEDTVKDLKDFYSYLTGPKNTGAPLDSNKKVAQVTVSGPSGTGVAGQPVGPIRFGGSEKTLPLTVSDPASNWEIVDADGNAIDKAKAPVGKDLYLKVPADAPAGSATISTSVKKSNLSGKVLFEKSGKKHGQTTVIIDSDDSESSASVSVSWDAAQEPTPTPTPSDTPTPTPSDTPTPTPSDTPSVTPTPTPCVPGQGGTDENGNPCETPSVTPTPTPCVPGQGGTDENGKPCGTPAPSVTPAPSSTPTACVPGQGGTDENGKPCVVVPTTCVPDQGATADKHGAVAKDKAGKADVCVEPGLPATGV